jgi:hypothetical protein
VRLAGEVVWTDFTSCTTQLAKVPQSSRQLLDNWLKSNLHRQTEAGGSRKLVNNYKVLFHSSARGWMRPETAGCSHGCPVAWVLKSML